MGAKVRYALSEFTKSYPISQRWTASQMNIKKSKGQKKAGIILLDNPGINEIYLLFS